MRYEEVGPGLLSEDLKKHNRNYKAISADIDSLGGKVDNAIEEVSTAAFNQVVDAAKLNWKEPVATVADLATTYPTAAAGDASMTRDTGKVYRYDGADWGEIQQIDAGPVNEVDTRLTDLLAETEEELNDTYSFSEVFDPSIVARENGRHIAFGSICRLATLKDVSLPNRNLLVYRSGTSHQSNGIIKGVIVSDRAEAMSEPFTIAAPADYSNIGRGGIATPNDFRDPNLLQLPNGQILLTFFALNFAENDDRTQMETYAMLGTFNSTFRTIDWTSPTLLLNRAGLMAYGKPIISGSFIYSATYEGNWTGKPDSTYKGYVIQAPLNDPLNWSIVGTPFFEHGSYLYTEPILRERPGGGYFIQTRKEGQGFIEIVRFDCATINGTWSAPVTIYEGSAHAKGLEVLSDGTYFTGIRLKGNYPGVAILTTNGSAAEPVSLKLSGVVHTNQIPSDESGYMEFMKLSEEEYLGTFFTETGRTIQCFTFSVAMIKNKKVRENESAFPIKKVIGAERLSSDVHLGFTAARSFNLLNNPTLHIPFGLGNAPYWSGTTIGKSDGLEADGPGSGYAKVTTSGGQVTQRLKMSLSRLFEKQPIVAAARIYCKSKNRVRLLITFGTQVTSVYHNGTGWETITLQIKHATGHSSATNGTKDDTIIFQFSTGVGDSINYYVDWVTCGFGETIPEVANTSIERVSSMARVLLNSKTNTFTIADLGLPSPASSQLSYTVNLLESNFEILGYSVTKTTTTFTITLTDGTLWGSNKFATLELIGLG